MSPAINPLVDVGFKDGQSYDLYRPTYPAAVVEKLRDLVKSERPDPVRILDLAAGTGKFTELIAAQPENWEITAVEPNPGMRDVLQSKRLKNVNVVEGAAENMESVPSGWANAVVIAQAFHWFANLAALREIHRVLVPGGLLFLIWNKADVDSLMDLQSSTTWIAKSRQFFDVLKDKQNVSKTHDSSWPEVFDKDQGSSPNDENSQRKMFRTPLQEQNFRRTEWHKKEYLWQHFSTISFVATLTDAQRQEAKKKLFEILDADDVEVDGEQRVAVPIRTDVFWTFAESA